MGFDRKAKIQTLPSHEFDANRRLLTLAPARVQQYGKCRISQNSNKVQTRFSATVAPFVHLPSFCSHRRCHACGLLESELKIKSHWGAASKHTNSFKTPRKLPF